MLSVVICPYPLVVTIPKAISAVSYIFVVDIQRQI